MGPQRIRQFPWRTARIFLALLLAALAVWLGLRRIQWAVLGATISGADWPVVGLALATLLATTWAKAVRWHWLIRQSVGHVSFGRTWRLLLIGQLGNTLLPARFGDGARAVLLGSQPPGGIPAAVGSLVGEKALDGLVGTILLLALALLTPLPPWMRAPVLGTALLTTALLVLLVLLGFRSRPAVWLANLLSGWLPAHLGPSLSGALSNLSRAVGRLGRGTGAVWASLWTLVAWGLAALTNFLVLAALHVEAPWWGSPLVLTVVFAAGFLPSAPAQLGVFEYACVLALSAAGVRPEGALSFGLVLHALVLAPPALLGPVAMAVEGLGWHQLRESTANHPEGQAPWIA